MDPPEQAESSKGSIDSDGQEAAGTSSREEAGQSDGDVTGHQEDEGEAGAEAKETSNNDNNYQQDKQDNDAQDNGDDDEETARKGPAAAAVIETPLAPSRTLVGGLIASSKSMKPVRSPLSGRPSNHIAPSSSVATPSKSSSSSSLAKSAITPFRTSTSSSTPSVTRRSSAASSAALKKPFRSPVVSRAPAKGTEQNTPSISEDAASSSMTSFQLSTALPALERRLALLKNAKRLLAAREQNEDVADNTAHIRVLSEKWLAAGREAADMLYDLTKDAYDNLDNDERQKNGGSLNNTSKKSNNGYQNQSNGWGWDIKNEEEEKQARIKAEIDAMDDEQREEYMESVEREEERNPLPEISELTSIKNKKRPSATDSDKRDEERRKRARLEEQRQEDDQNEAEYRSPPPEQPEENEEEEASDTEPIDDPLKRGMARMLTQTGIDIKTLGWDAVKEEWDSSTEILA